MVGRVLPLLLAGKRANRNQETSPGPENDHIMKHMTTSCCAGAPHFICCCNAVAIIAITIELTKNLMPV
jgi:hypothetical protein